MADSEERAITAPLPTHAVRFAQRTNLVKPTWHDSLEQTVLGASLGFLVGDLYVAYVYLKYIGPRLIFTSSNENLTVSAKFSVEEKEEEGCL